MKAKLLLAAAGLLTVMSLMVSCSDDNDPAPGTASLAKAYLQPTGFSINDYRDLTPEERYNKANVITFSGSYITPESAPEEFLRLSRLFGDTAYSKSKAAYWHDNYRQFLGRQVTGFRAIATDDSWGVNYPQGSDVSSLFKIGYVSARRYIDSGYADVDAYAQDNYVKMSEWNPRSGSSLCPELSLHILNIPGLMNEGNTMHYSGNCQGHKYTLEIIFSDGTMTSANNYVFCNFVPAGY